MYREEDYLLLSGLQHLRFCPRQCAFIHIEQLWTENFFTAQGRVQHEKVHSGSGESRGQVRTERSLRIASSELGLIGQTDAVEFYKNGTVIPVEYKHGSPKHDTTDEVQLCAQAVCLEEMLHCSICEGALFYFKVKKRIPVPLTEELRRETIQLAGQFHQFVAAGVTPPAVYSKKCGSCSFIDTCFPESAGKCKSIDGYIKRRLLQEPETGEKE
mgnify:CR=1 FL=1